jgi:ligand-binding SRPBCC domain-containing protein
MAEYILQRELEVELPRERVFDFFADAGNLERITPPELQFRILTKQPFTIAEGTLIDYRLRLRGLPIKWRTAISVWDPPCRFVDRQLSGPYKQWVHTHTFTEKSSNRTFIQDEVRYRLPLEPVGDVAHFIVKRELEYIFDFRQKAVAEILRHATGHSPQ